MELTLYQLQAWTAIRLFRFAKRLNQFGRWLHPAHWHPSDDDGEPNVH